MPDLFTATQWLTSLNDPALGLDYTRHAMVPGMSESSEDAQMVKAIAYWLSVLQAGGWVPQPAAAPVPTAPASGGSVANGTYGFIMSYVNSVGGESIGSLAGSVVAGGSGISTLACPSPPAITNATGWYCYITAVNGSTYTRQQAAGSPTAIGTAYTRTTPPTTTGVNPFAVDNSTGFQYSQAVLDAYFHLTARLAYFRNPQGVVYNGDRT